MAYWDRISAVEQKHFFDQVWKHQTTNGLTMGQYLDDKVSAVADTLMNAPRRKTNNATSRNEHINALARQIGADIGEQLCYRGPMEDFLNATTDEQRNKAMETLVSGTLEVTGFFNGFGGTLPKGGVKQIIESACQKYLKSARQSQQFIEVDEYGVEYYKDPVKLQELIDADHNLVRGLWPIDPLSERWPLGHRPDPQNPEEMRVKAEKAEEFAYNSFKPQSAKREIVRHSIRAERMKLDIFQKMLDGKDTTEDKRNLMQYHTRYGSRAYYKQFGVTYGDWPPADELVEQYKQNVAKATPAEIEAAFEMAVAPYKKKWGIGPGQNPSQEQLDQVNDWFKHYSEQLHYCVRGRPQDFSN